MHLQVERRHRWRLDAALKTAGAPEFGSYHGHGSAAVAHQHEPTAMERDGHRGHQTRILQRSKQSRASAPSSQQHTARLIHGSHHGSPWLLPLSSFIGSLQ